MHYFCDISHLIVFVLKNSYLIAKLMNTTKQALCDLIKTIVFF